MLNELSNALKEITNEEYDLEQTIHKKGADKNEA